MTNKLFYGDNLDVLRDHIASAYPRLQTLTVSELRAKNRKSPSSTPQVSSE